jgi:peptide/nickel transport system substrate-binding protein
VPFSNASGYSNPRVDEILETAAVEPNFEKRKALYFELQKIVYEDIPSIGFVHQDEVNVFNTRLRNHAPTTTDHLAGAWLKQA